jgi:DcuC family C4-dicarboxylate transporter
MSVLLTIAGFAVIFLAVLAILRGSDVRLAMLIAGFALGAMAGDISVILRAFLTTLADEQYILPICSAMGFAYVLRQSGCDRQLVLLLTTPIRKLQFFLIPAAIAVAFIVNSAMISQASTAVAVGTVLIPLLRSAGFSPAVVGATLVLGASIGGELLNPGAPELQSISRRLNPQGTLNIQPILAPLLAVQLVVATIIFWWMVGREPKTEFAADVQKEKINYFQAMVPIIPLVVLLLVGPPFHVWRVPEEWLMNPGGPGKYASRLIATAMLLGCVITAVAAPSIVPTLVKSFFEGVGYAFTNIVSIIVCANCFGKGIESMKLADWIGTWTKTHPGLVWPLAGSITMLFGVISGSGMAATESLYRFFAQDGASQDHNLAIGSVVSIAAAAGRTSSPAAAVVLLVSTLMEVKPVEILRRVAPPLVLATAVTAATGWWWWR